MVVKQCHSRLKLFAFNHEMWFDATCNTERAAVSDISIKKYVSTTAASSFCSLAPLFRNVGTPRRQRPTHEHLIAVSPVFVRELRTSSKALQSNLNTNLPCESQKLYFDTHAVVRVLEENGFTSQQAEVIVKILVRTTKSNMDVIYGDMVTKMQQEIWLQTVTSQISALKKDMIILEKSEFCNLLAENEKLKIQLVQLGVQLADVMNKVRADTILDMSVEKSRVKELKTEHEKKLLKTRAEIMEMAAEQGRHLTRANMKIDTEVAGLKTMLESLKLDTIKYLAGSIFTCLTVVLGFYRIWM
ncbi:mitochondrial calcium uniporter regulator 1 [Thalassophryne amazonica]|uniref:mitochondrial calcium uniporter regulator 1 n=1 Tax=Thalassophryne amazonica TaxID=390379 RepID=UPI0014720929|nr:mitochondrial calcium uniporter regulator 1 [Thalassophryne amazonica]